MARKKKVTPTTVNLCYYAYYDGKTGQLLSVSNERNDFFEFGIEISKDDALKLIAGEWQFKDYLIGYQKQTTGVTAKCIIPNTDQEYAFRYNLFEWITENDIDEEFCVKWDLSNKQWEFSVKNVYKKEYSKEIISSRFVFFITLQDDLDFLIRTIFIEKDELMNTDRVIVPFESSKELDIQQLSISSKLVFKSYKLMVTYE